MASAVDFILEGLYAQKKISRSEEFQYQGAEPPRRAPRGVTPEQMIERDIQLPAGAGQQEEVLQLKPSCASYGGSAEALSREAGAGR